MGILNLDPESFYKESISTSIEESVTKVSEMCTNGMDILDIGAFSSRPGMITPPIEIERKRLIPHLKSIKYEFPELIISVDTMRSEIASEVLDLGVDIINDISGSVFDSNIPKEVVKYNKSYLAMHMKGLPINMMNSQHTFYQNVIQEIIYYFSDKIYYFDKLGLNKVLIDPGFGFSKNLDDNFNILKNLNTLKILNKPILVGISRKSMIWKTLDTDISDSLIGTLIAEFYAILKGAQVIRVHDIKATSQMLKIYHSICN